MPVSFARSPTPPGGVLVTDAELSAAIAAATAADAVADDARYPSFAFDLRPRVARRITDVDIIAGFQSGHGWTFSGQYANGDTNDTSDYCRGSQSMTVDTSGTGASGFILSPNPDTTRDATGKAFRVWVKVSDATQLADFSFWACSGASFANAYWWDVQNYTAGVQYVQPGEWTPITFHLGVANVEGSPVRSALNRFKFQIKDKGTASVSLGINGVEMIPEPTSAYPNGVVSITFDDSYSSQYDLGKPSLDAYGYTGTVYTICDAVGTSGRLSVAQLTELQDQGWEIAAHAATQAKHDMGFQNLTAGQISTEIVAARKWIVDNGFRDGDHFAYPGGHFEGDVRDTLRPYVTSARTIYGHNQETWPPADPHKLRSLQPSATTTTAAITAAIDAAYTGKGWFILSFHDIVTSGATSVQYTKANLDTVLAHLHTKGCAVRTVGQVIRGE